MEKRRTTFLSYSRANKDFALKLAKELKSEGFHIWLDQLDIPPGARWDVEVERALVDCEIFMIIMTRASAASENVLDEIGYAVDNGKRLLPVLLEPCNVPFRLRRFQYVDFTDKNFDDGVQSAKELLRNLIAQPSIPRADLPEVSRDQSVQAGADRSAGQKAEKIAKARAEAERVNAQEAEQELSFKAEEAKLERGKAGPEKTEAQPAARDVAQPVPAKPRPRLIAIFGIAVIALFIAGYAITRLVSGPASAEIPTETQAQTREISTSTLEAPLVPITADASATPITEAATAAQTPTEAATPTEAETPTASAPASEIIDGKGVEMVLVPEDEFLMGSTRGELAEQPIHTVYLNAFYIDKFEVTNKLYKTCVDDGKCDPPRQTYFFAESPNRLYYDNPQYDNYPVIYVDWNMAKAYCEWRGARLPTEAEWEKAARGKEANTYPWGKDLDCQKANYQNCVNRTSEAGSYPAGVSPYGVYDMAGNVWEWVADWYSDDYYSKSSGNNPSGPITGQSRVMRGGSWPKFDVTSYHRNKFAPDYNTFDIGFRCAASQ